MTDAIKITSENLTETLTQSSIKNNQAIENFNNKLLEIMNDRGIVATYFVSPLSEIINPEETT